MNVEEFKALPEGLDSAEVAKIVDVFLAEEPSDSRAARDQKIDVICDRQWHTYELPSPDTQEKIRKWIISNWEASQDFARIALWMCYSFGLEKALFVRALDEYSGDQRWEYVQMLERSLGDSIDPYWSLRKDSME